MVDEVTGQRSPGWYADDSGTQRWWSGQGWTEHTQPAQWDRFALREDIAAAKAQMKRISLGAGRELLSLPRFLADDELVQRVAIGSFANSTGLLALTDRRVFFFKHGILGQAFQDYPLGTITSVTWVGGMVLGRLLITASGSRAEITAMEKTDGRAMADAIRGSIGRGAMVTAKARPAIDIPAQLLQLKSLLDANVLNQAEYDAKKAELLARM